MTSQNVLRATKSETVSQVQELLKKSNNTLGKQVVLFYCVCMPNANYEFSQMLID